MFFFSTMHIFFHIITGSSWNAGRFSANATMRTIQMKAYRLVWMRCSKMLNERLYIYIYRLTWIAGINKHSRSCIYIIASMDKAAWNLILSPLYTQHHAPNNKFSHVALGTCILASRRATCPIISRPVTMANHRFVRSRES